MHDVVLRALRRAPFFRPLFDEYDRMSAEQKQLFAQLELASAERAAAISEREAAISERDAVLAQLHTKSQDDPGITSIEEEIGVQSFDGFQIYGFHSDPTVSSQVLHGLYEPEVTAVFRRHVRPGMCVVDIGANIGYFTLLGASLVGSTGKVIAVEANPKNAKLLEASRRLNGFSNIDIANVAVGAASGLLSLWTDHSNGMTPKLADEILAPLKSETIPCLQLRQVLAGNPKIDVIKIDIEGSEYLALAGADEIIARDRPVIISEFAPWALDVISGVSAAEYLSFFVDRGFKLSVILRSGDTQEHGTDIAAVIAAFQATGGDHIDILCEPA